ncbi:protoporphyrinogen oxidase [Sporosarcina sp. SAFN-015]|uniref:protoporphyrinogen oxidase n=1 Tax=Sporosarcina sp. SAFN-015 TaxID=3387274 RepID=UPI003F7D6FE2
MNNGQKHIVVLGGGITGLSAAYYARKLSEERNTPLTIHIIEKSGVLGGRIQTVKKDGFIIEKGPDSFLSRKLPIIELSRELGLENELVGTNPKARANYIYLNKKLHPMPLGLVLGIPTKLTPFLKTGLISPMGKARAAMDIFMPRKTGSEDESLGHFVERRLGKEVLEHITEPLLGGIYSGNARKISTKATFPHFLALERKYGSLIKGMLKGKQPSGESHQYPEIAKKSMFLTYRHGMQSLINRLIETMKDIHMLTDCSVESISATNRQYDVQLSTGESIRADGLIMAVPSSEAAKLLRNEPGTTWLHKINYVSVANIAIAYDASTIPYPLNGTGFVIPRKEGKDLTACTWTSSKWSHSAPKDKVLLRCYVGNEQAQDWVDLTDDQLLQKVQSDLKEIMGITAKPLFHEVTRAVKAMPQYPVNHVEELAAVRQALQRTMPGVFLCGAGYEGVGVPDCILQGKQVAGDVLDYLKFI